MAQTTAKNEYRLFEAALKEARIPGELWDGLGDVWVENPPRAYHLVKRFKDTGDAQLRLKQSGIIDQALARLQAACQARAQTVGDQVIADYINKCAEVIGPSSGSAGGSLADDEAPITTKEAGDTFLGLAGFHQTAAAQGQARAQLLDAINPYKNK
jgi:hypothetical protein